MAESDGLENRCVARHRGFESHSLRQVRSGLPVRACGFGPETIPHTSLTSLPTRIVPAMAGSMRERQPGVWERRVRAGRTPVTGKQRQISRTLRGASRQASNALARLVTEAQDSRRTDGPLDRPLSGRARHSHGSNATGGRSTRCQGHQPSDHHGRDGRSRHDLDALRRRHYWMSPRRPVQGAVRIPRSPAECQQSGPISAVPSLENFENASESVGRAADRTPYTPW